MSAVSPYAVGSTVKWREGDTEYAGMVTFVRLDPDTSGTGPEEEWGRAETFEPVYEIALIDHPVVTKFHSELVLV